MSTWQSARDQIQAAFQTQFDAAGASPTVGIAWEGEQRPFASQLLILSVVSWDVLHDRVVLTRSGANLEKTISSLVQARVQVRAESAEAGGGDHALSVAERARIGMLLGGFHAELTDIEIIKPDTVPTTALRVNYESDGRTITATVFEFDFRMELTLADPQTYYSLTQVKVCGDVDDVSGDEIEVLCKWLPEDSMGLNELHFSKFLTLDGAGVTLEASVDGSGTPQYFEIRPPAGSIWYLARLFQHIKCGGTAAWDEYGDITALTNGLSYKAVRGTGVGATVTQDITDDLHTIKTNDDTRMYQFDMEIVDNGSGPSKDSIHGRLTFARFGPGLNGGIFLDGDLDDAFRITINDDLTGLAALHFITQGQIYNSTQVSL